MRTPYKKAHPEKQTRHPLSSRALTRWTRFTPIPICALLTLGSSYVALLMGQPWILLALAVWAGCLIWAWKWSSEIYHVEMEGHTLEFTDFKQTFRRDAKEITDVQTYGGRLPSITVSFVPKPDHPAKIRFIPRGAAFMLPIHSLADIKARLLTAKQNSTENRPPTSVTNL